MAITYAGALVYEATLALKDERAGKFDPKYAPYALKPFPYGGAGVNMTYTPIIPPAPTYDVWVQFKQVRVGPFYQSAGVGGGHMMRIDDVNGGRLASFFVTTNFSNVLMQISDQSYLTGGNIMGFFPEGEMVTYTINVKQDGVNHYLKFYVNGILQYVFSYPDTRQKNIGKVSFSHPFHYSGVCEFAISEMMMSDGEPLLGARLATMSPVDDAVENTWNGTWQSLADEDTGSGISTDMLNARIAGNFSDYEGANSPIGIRALVQSMRYVDNNSGLRVRGYLRKNGVNIDTVDQTTQDESRVLTIWDSNPYTNDDWQVGDLETVNGGVRSLAYI